MLPCKMVPGVHIVRDLPFARWLRRTLKDPNIMTYYNVRANCWAIGTWLSKSGGVVLEGELLGPSPQLVSRDHADMMRAERSPKRQEWLREFKAKLLSDNRADLRQFADECAYHLAVREWIRKRTRHWADHPGWAAL